MPRKPKPRTSGPTVPEARRERKQVLLRLSDAERDALDALADGWGLSRSDAVVRLIEAASPRARAAAPR